MELKCDVDVTVRIIAMRPTGVADKILIEKLCAELQIKLDDLISEHFTSQIDAMLTTDGFWRWWLSHNGIHNWEANDGNCND